MGVSCSLADYSTTALLCSRQTFINSARFLVDIWKRYKSVVPGSNSLAGSDGVADCWLSRLEGPIVG